MSAEQEVCEVDARLVDARSRTTKFAYVMEPYEEDLPEFSKEAIALQFREAEKHRELVALLPTWGGPGAAVNGARMTG